MNWCVIRHPDLGAAVVAEPSLVVHEPRGWARVSEFVSDRNAIDLDEYTAEPEAADKPEATPTPDAVPAKPAAEKTTKATAKNRGEN